MYMQQVVQGKTTPEMAADLQNQPVAGAPGATPPAAPAAAGASQEIMAVIAALQSGQTPELPATPNPALIQAIADFIASPDFQALDPAIQQNAASFAQSLADAAQGNLPAQSATVTAV